MLPACHHFLCLHPLVNQCHVGSTCEPRSLEAMLGSPAGFFPASYHLLAACASVCSDKMLRLERPAAQDTHYSTAHVGVARCHHTHPQDSPTCRGQCSPKFGAFLFHVVGETYGLGSLHTSVKDLAHTIERIGNTKPFFCAITPAARFRCAPSCAAPV